MGPADAARSPGGTQRCRPRPGTSPPCRSGPGRWSVRCASTRWDYDVDLTFRFLDPDGEVAALDRAGLRTVARLEREPYAGAEHPSRRCTLLVGRPTATPA